MPQAHRPVATRPITLGSAPPWNGRAPVRERSVPATPFQDGDRLRSPRSLHGIQRFRIGADGKSRSRDDIRLVCPPEPVGASDRGPAHGAGSCRALATHVCRPAGWCRGWGTGSLSGASPVHGPSPPRLHLIRIRAWNMLGVSTRTSWGPCREGGPHHREESRILSATVGSHECQDSAVFSRTPCGGAR